MKITIIVCIYMTLCNVGFSDVVFDIGYEPPTYTNGQILGGSGPTVRDNLYGFSDQAVEFANCDGLRYTAPEPYTSGVHNINFQACAYSGESSEVFDFMTDDSRVSIAMYVNRIEYGAGYIPGQPRPSIASTTGQVYSFEFSINLDAGVYDFWLDGNQLLDDYEIFMPNDPLSEISFGQSQTYCLAGLDNFRWEVVPEPSALLLLIGGGSLLLVWRRKRRHI